MTTVMSAPHQSDALLTLRGAAVFRGVPEPDVSALCSEFETIAVPRGAVVFTQGEPGDYLYVLLSGKVKLVRTSSTGRESLVALIGPGEQFGELSVFDPGPRISSAIAVTTCQLARVSREAITTWVHSRPAIATQLLRVLARRLRRTNSIMADLIFIDVPGRVAKELLKLATRFGTISDGAVHVEYDLSQEELGQLVGASRETVNKALATFTDRHWIRVTPKGVVILDREALARRAR